MKQCISCGSPMSSSYPGPYCSGCLGGSEAKLDWLENQRRDYWPAVEFFGVMLLLAGVIVLVMEVMR